MDNITHSLVGLGMGELLHRTLAPELDAARDSTRRRLLLLTCVVASNLPDLDLLLTPLLPAPLGYLLHHRGLTHTVLLALPQALLLAALVYLFWPAARTLLKESKRSRIGLGLSIVLGLGLHLAMDYLNSYGLHPFYPFDTHWFYGDAVFIIEPVFWLAFGVPLALTIERPRLRVALLAGFSALLIFFTLQGFLLWSSLAVLGLIGLAVGALQLRAGARGRGALLLGLALSIGFVVVQGVASVLGAQQVRAALQAADPASRTLDVAMTAFPTQPLCWVFVSIQSDEQADRYRLRRGIFSLAPRWLAPGACPAGLREASHNLRLTPALALVAQQDGSLSVLRRLERDNCYVAAWLRFARMPAMGADMLSDFRFAATPRGNFTSLDLRRTAPAACPSYIPGWDMPRRDLLTPPGANEKLSH